MRPGSPGIDVEIARADSIMIFRDIDGNHDRVLDSP